MTLDELDILESRIGSSISTLTTAGTLIQQVKESKTQCCNDDSMFANIDPELLDMPHIKDLENDPVTIAMRPFFTQKQYNKIIVDTHIMEMTGVRNDETETLIRSTINNIIKAADAIRNDQEDESHDSSVEIREISHDELPQSVKDILESCNITAQTEQDTKQYDIIEKLLNVERRKTAMLERLNEQLREKINELRTGEVNHDELPEAVKILLEHL